MGRSWLAPPSGFKPAAHDCFVPKNRIHTWGPQARGISAVKFLPVSGHLLLSACMDGPVRMYDVYNDRRMLALYEGHSEAVRDIVFVDGGKQFFSVSYDKYLKLWDTETGQVVSKHTTGHTPLCVAPHPLSAHECLTGMQNKVIAQWDLRANEVAQQYTDHMGAVNTCTFLGTDGKGFVSSSDDKKLLVWDYGVNAVIKHISEPDLHSVPSVAMHPSGQYFVGNAQDNQALVFACGDRVKLNRRKRFHGHSTAGFACGLTFSPDGQYLCSGDAEGRLFFWEWKTGRQLRRIKAHDQVSIGVQWHPAEPSRLVSCSWDGTIKYWD